MENPLADAAGAAIDMQERLIPSLALRAWMGFGVWAYHADMVAGVCHPPAAIRPLADAAGAAIDVQERLILSLALRAWMGRPPLSRPKLRAWKTIRTRYVGTARRPSRVA